ncbi:haloacid dehalogenase-like hydrolase [Streptomyces longispororuber]|uniref:haloacid dehalogenase-like hydrolase n=1 Tax=Streptomyces longispororuber TaxID=68230 RepID=UPI0036F5E39F
MRNRNVCATLAAAAALVAGPVALPAAAATAAPASHSGAHCPQLSKKLTWYGDNRARLQKVIDERGTCSDPHLGHGGHQRPVAAFDWDNTVVKNDVTDATISWALRHDKILRPKSWKSSSKWMTDAGHRALTRACGTTVPVGRPLPTSTDTDCADEILQIREDGTTMSGAAAFAGTWNHRRTVPQYAWVPQLFAGHGVKQVEAYAKKARAEALAAPVGTTRTVGSHTVPGYARYYAQQRDLIRTLKKAGFDVYIVSAGSEPVAEVWSRGVGIDRKHTIAIRSVLDREGRITTRNQGCGGVGANKGDVIPYIDGKRCFVNQEIFKVKGKKAWDEQRWGKRIAVGGGDADTDVTFVGDATGAHLVLNRNKSEFMCRAYDNADGRWVVNPMFIEPLPQKSGTYPCSTTAYNAPDGRRTPVLRPDGSVVPDQRDSVH